MRGPKPRREKQKTTPKKYRGTIKATEREHANVLTPSSEGSSTVHENRSSRLVISRAVRHHTHEPALVLSASPAPPSTRAPLPSQAAWHVPAPPVVFPRSGPSVPALEQTAATARVRPRECVGWLAEADAAAGAAAADTASVNAAAMVSDQSLRGRSDDAAFSPPLLSQASGGSG